MTEKFYYSPGERGFFPASMFDLYSAAGGLPTDLIEITDAEYLKFNGAVPVGKELGVLDGKLAWVTFKPDLELVGMPIEEIKNSRLVTAKDKIFQLDLLLEFQPEDPTLLSELLLWKMYYRDLLLFTDGDIESLPTAPDA